MTPMPPDAGLDTVRVTERKTVRRFPARGIHEREVVNAIFDECLIAHVGFQHDGQPAVLPLAFWRNDDHVYWHGSTKNRLMLDMVAGAECLPVPLHGGMSDSLRIGRVLRRHSVPPSVLEHDRI